MLFKAQSPICWKIEDGDPLSVGQQQESEVVYGKIPADVVVSPPKPAVKPETPSIAVFRSSLKKTPSEQTTSAEDLFSVFTATPCSEVKNAWELFLEGYSRTTPAASCTAVATPNPSQDRTWGSYQEMRRMVERTGMSLTHPLPELPGSARDIAGENSVDIHESSNPFRDTAGKECLCPWTVLVEDAATISRIESLASTTPVLSATSRPASGPLGPRQFSRLTTQTDGREDPDTKVPDSELRIPESHGEGSVLVGSEEFPEQPTQESMAKELQELQSQAGTGGQPPSVMLTRSGTLKSTQTLDVASGTSRSAAQMHQPASLIEKSRVFPYQFGNSATRKWRAIGVFCETKERFECFQLFLGASAYAVTTILLSANLSDAQILRILQKTKLFSVVSNMTVARRLLGLLLTEEWKAETLYLRNIVVFGSITAREKLDAATHSGIRILSWANFLDLSRVARACSTPAPADQIALLCFKNREKFLRESGHGSVAEEKRLRGVMVTHRSLVAAVASFLCVTSSESLTKSGVSTPAQPLMSQETRLMIFQSLLELVDVVAALATFYSGGQVVFSTAEVEPSPCHMAYLGRNGMKYIIEQAQRYKPTLLVPYPPFLHHLYHHILLRSAIIPNAKRARKFRKALETRGVKIVEGRPASLRAWFSDVRHFSVYNRLLGEKLQRIFVPNDVNPEILRKLQLILKVPVALFFATMETTGPVFMRYRYPVVETDRFDLFSPAVEMLASDPRVPEALRLRGPMLTAGHFLLDTETPGQPVPLDAEGWLHLLQDIVVSDSLQQVQVLQPQLDNAAPSVLLAPLLELPYVLRARILEDSSVEVVLSKDTLESWERSKQRPTIKPAIETLQDRVRTVSA